MLVLDEVYKLAKETVNYLKENHTSLVKEIDDYLLAQYATAIAWVESNFDPVAKNKTSTATGLMQVLKGTREWVESDILGIDKKSQSELKKKRYAMLIGMAYLAYNQQRYKSWKKAIIAYNQGHYNSSEDGRKYLKKVLEKHDIIDKTYRKPKIVERILSKNYYRRVFK